MRDHRQRIQAWAQRAAHSEVVEGRLFASMDASLGCDAAPTCLNKFVARRQLLFETGAGERVVQDILEDS
jgi:hypothetical protein